MQDCLTLALQGCRANWARSCSWSRGRFYFSLGVLCTFEEDIQRSGRVSSPLGAFRALCASSPPMSAAAVPVARWHEGREQEHEERHALARREAAERREDRGGHLRARGSRGREGHRQANEVPLLFALLLFKFLNKTWTIKASICDLLIIFRTPARSCRAPSGNG